MNEEIIRATIVRRINDNGEYEPIDSVWVNREDGKARAEEINQEGYDAEYQSLSVFTNPWLLPPFPIIDTGGDWWDSEERQKATAEYRAEP